MVKPLPFPPIRTCPPGWQSSSLNRTSGPPQGRSGQVLTCSGRLDHRKVVWVKPGVGEPLVKSRSTSMFCLSTGDVIEGAEHSKWLAITRDTTYSRFPKLPLFAIGGKIGTADSSYPLPCQLKGVGGGQRKKKKKKT